MLVLAFARFVHVSAVICYLLAFTSLGVKPAILPGTNATDRAKRTLKLFNPSLPPAAVQEYLSERYDGAQSLADRHLNGEGRTSAKHYNLEDKAFDVLIEGMFGCTAVVLMSERDVWVAHFWERPGFQSAANFERDVMDILRYGSPETGRSPLQLYRDYSRFRDTENPRAVVFTPFDTGRGSPHLAWEFMLRYITNFIKDELLFPAGNIEMCGYTAADHSGQIASQHNNPSGKVLFQYDPVQSRLEDVQPTDTERRRPYCPRQQSKARVWCEARLALDPARWLTWPNQIVPPPLSERDSDDCEEVCIEPENGPGDSARIPVP
jgi:hypothetical protein